MNLDLGALNWVAVVVCFVIGQIYLTMWFTIIFGEAWAKVYDPTKAKAEHTKEIPGFTYGIGAICTFLLILGLAILQLNLGISSISGGFSFGAFISVFFVLATTIPGYAFLRRWNALWLAVSSQVSLIFILSVVLAVWK
ncbi:MAG: DUF1761 domain-containing protein [Cyclobacteriaceae bacterium]